MLRARCESRGSAPAMAVQWAPLLGALFAGGAEGSEMQAARALKKAVKLAKREHQLPTLELRGALEAFLQSGKGGFRLEGDMVVRADAGEQRSSKKKKHKKDKTDKAAGRTAGGAQAEANGAAHAKKKRKRGHGDSEPAEQQQQREEQQQEEASKPGGEGKRKKGKKRKAAGKHQQEAAADEGGAPRAKRRKGAKGGAAAGTAAGGSSGGGGGGRGDAIDEEAEEVLWRDSQKRRDVKSGPFSKAEKATLRQAVEEYASKHGHPTDSFDWLFDSSRQKATKGMWKKIATALPRRTFKAVWAAGTRMFHEGNYQGKWSPEEDAQLLQLVSEKGRRWKDIGGAVGRMPEACRDRWLMIRQGSAKKEGKWAPDETERLRQAVQEYLAARTAAEAGDEGAEEEAATLTLDDIVGAAQEPVVDSDGAATVTVSRRIVLDDIDWNVVSQAVGTRSNVQCLEKWYTQLSPSMVSRGEWGSGDDRRLLRALYLSGAEHDYELDWGQLVRGRTAQQARRRWRLMTKAVPDARDLEFSELVDSLVDRFLPQLKEQQQQAQQQAQQ